MFDLVIRKAKEIVGPSFDIGIQAGKIVAIQPIIREKGKKEYCLTSKQFLSAGWIDDHVHCFEKMTLYYDYPDEIGIKKGVSTVIDAGTTGAKNVGAFFEYAKKAKTNVYALLNISKCGIVAQDELADLSKVQEKLVKKSIEELVIENNSIIAFQLAVPHNFFVYNIEKHDPIIDINKIVNSLPEELAIWIR